MDVHVIVEKPVSRAIGRFNLPRETLIRLFATIHSVLPHSYSVLRFQRDPEDPDCFRYRIELASSQHWHIFYFRVNDTRAQGYLFVETVDYEMLPM